MYIQIGVLYLTLDQIDFMNRIKEVLGEKGYTQTWLSSKMGKSYNIVNGYCNNKKQPSLETIFTIAEILNVRPKDLIKDKK